MTWSTPSRGPGSEMEVHVQPVAGRRFAAMDPVLGVRVRLGSARQLQPVAALERPLVARRRSGGDVDELLTVVTHQPRLDLPVGLPAKLETTSVKGSAAVWVSAGPAGR